ncbi:MAG: molybdenum cofactor guanylyltransferase [Candidatus Latescibacterota bacterium]
MIIAGAILAGGRASRFGGRPKGLIRLPTGETIIERLIAEMRKADIASCMISSNEEKHYAALGVPVVEDLHGDCGPLGGIEAALNYFRETAEGVLFLAGDTPFVTVREIGRLCGRFRENPDGIVFAATEDGRQHPLSGVVPVAKRQRIEQAVAAGHLSVKKLWQELDAVGVPFEHAERFRNINTPADFDCAFD